MKPAGELRSIITRVMMNAGERAALEQLTAKLSFPDMSATLRYAFAKTCAEHQITL